MAKKKELKGDGVAEKAVEAKVGSVKERRAARQSAPDRVRETAHESVMSDEEFAESKKHQVKKL